MEFAWGLVEPERGRYDFSLFERAVNTLSRNGLKTILGTPTATFPPWLLDEGNVLQSAYDGSVRNFGARRMGCMNAPAYRAAAFAVVEAAAEKFGKDKRIAGWQVDNEIGHEGSDRCYCEHCRDAWHRWLERKYREPAAMNDAWGAVFWGTSFSRFDQVPQPRKQVATGFNPGLLLDYDRFMSDTAVSFVESQIEILRPRLHPDAFITTNLFPPPFSCAIDMERLTRKMEFASWDNYPIWGPMQAPYPPQFQACVLSYARGLASEGTFAIMEQFSGMQGHVCLGALPPEKQAALWTVQAIARGADKILYFRWRTAPYGQEQLCYGLFDTDGRDTERSRVLRATIKRCKLELSHIAPTRVESDACLVYSKDDARVLREQYLSEGLLLKPTEWLQAGYDAEAAKWYSPFAVYNVNADIKTPTSIDVERYALVSLPLYQMADPAFVSRLEAWVEKGGVLVVGYRSGSRDMRNWNTSDPLPGVFNELTGISVPRFEALGTASSKIGFRGLIGLVPTRGEVWADIIEPVSAETIARWTDRKKFYRGAAAITRNRFGKGYVYYVGTSPNAAAMLVLYRRVFRDAGIVPRFHGAGAELVERRTVDGDLVHIAMNHTPRPKRIMGKLLEPWGWRVVE